VVRQSAEAEIRDLDSGSSGINQHIFGLEVAMVDTFFMAVAHCIYQLLEQVPTFFFPQFPLFILLH
jgi:hypothetical protein